MTEQRRIRWYNPALQDFEWKTTPASDQEALSLLDSYPGTRDHMVVYKEWRDLGASIAAALIRVGEVAKEKDEGQDL